MCQEIFIYDRIRCQLVKADFLECVSHQQLVDTENQWGPARDAAKMRMREKGVGEDEIRRRFQHSHWDWDDKKRRFTSLSLSTKCFGIRCDGQMQGLVMLDLVRHHAKLERDEDKPLVYVDFLESAPWNLRELNDNPRYGLIGVRLIEAAVRQSLEEGFHGRVGLYALKQAEKFYGTVCGMECVHGEEFYGMKWFEFTREGAREFLDDGGSDGN
jgi:hypothetical protein